jgi:hypothetical protein
MLLQQVSLINYFTTRKLVYCNESHYNVKTVVVIGMCYCHQIYSWLRFVGGVATNIFRCDSQLNSL